MLAKSVEGYGLCVAREHVYLYHNELQQHAVDDRVANGKQLGGGYIKLLHV